MVYDIIEIVRVYGSDIWEVYGMVLEYRERKIVRVYGIENGGYGLGMSDGI